MPFDSSEFEFIAPSKTNPQETGLNLARLGKLRDFLNRLPPERFAMGTEGSFFRGDGPLFPTAGEVLHNCNTAACIAGWTCALFGEPDDDPNRLSAEEHLGLTSSAGSALFLPTGWSSRQYTPGQAVAVLDHLIATGEVDWSVAK